MSAALKKDSTHVLTTSVVHNVGHVGRLRAASHEEPVRPAGVDLLVSGFGLEVDLATDGFVGVLGPNLFELLLGPNLDWSVGSGGGEFELNKVIETVSLDGWLATLFGVSRLGFAAA